MNEGMLKREDVERMNLTQGANNPDWKQHDKVFKNASANKSAEAMLLRAIKNSILKAKSG